MCRLSSLLLALSAACLTPQRAVAHSLGAQCRLDRSTVQVEAYYDDDSPAPGARVTVQGPQQDIVARATTDSLGVCRFARPAAGEYLLIVDAGAGHRTEIKLTIPPGEAARADGAPATVSAGPPREEFTRYPWLKLGIGVAVIVATSLALFLARRLQDKRA